MATRSQMIKRQMRAQDKKSKRAVGRASSRRTGHMRVRHYFRDFNLRKCQEYVFKMVVISVVVLVIGGIWQLMRPKIRLRVNHEHVAAFRVPYRSIGLLKDYAAQYDIPFAELFVLFNAENDFFPVKSAVYDLSVLHDLYIADFEYLRRRYTARSLQPYVAMFSNLFSELMAFPIPSGWYENEPSIVYGDSWGMTQNFQGSAMHKGTAIIDRENVRGRVPVVSMTHGTVLTAGWDAQLGYFVKIKTINENLYLYAHLNNLAPGIAPGNMITAGQRLGQMGNSGGGDGAMFPVHLHIAISPAVDFVRGEFWINPYPLLRHMENITV